MTKKNQQIITGLGEGDIAGLVFLPGDPERVARISASWQDVREVARVREFVVHTGTLDGTRMTVASTGIGAPSTAIMVEELVRLGATTLIRIGNSGALSPDIELGDYVITTGSVRDDGTSRTYVDEGYPAVAHHDVVTALVSEARRAGARFHTGITASTDGFYSRNKVQSADGSLRPMAAHGYETMRGADRLLDWKAAGVLNIEMESSILLTLASLYRVRAGVICTVSDRCPWSSPGQDALSLDRNMAGCIDIALRAGLRLSGRS